MTKRRCQMEEGPAEEGTRGRASRSMRCTDKGSRLNLRKSEEKTEEVSTVTAGVD